MIEIIAEMKYDLILPQFIEKIRCVHFLSDLFKYVYLVL